MKLCCKLFNLNPLVFVSPVSVDVVLPGVDNSSDDPMTIPMPIGAQNDLASDVSFYFDSIGKHNTGWPVFYEDNQ